MTRQPIATMKMVMIICLVVSSMLLGSVLGRTPSQQPALTLKALNGQLYDCVDFYKQSSVVRHLTVKSHISKVALTLVSTTPENKPKGIGLKNGGCSSGTVPILRANIQNSDPPRPTFVPSQSQEHCVAVIQTNMDDSNRKFFKSNAAMTVYKPRVQNGQWSSTRIKLLNGVDSIEAGWMVNPLMFSDDDAHLYARFIAGQQVCVNHQCDGFVQVSKDVPLGIVPEKYSEIGGDQYTWNITIEKNYEDGNWWLILYDGADKSNPVGYWPKSLFTSLADVANQVEWGGEINNPGPTSPAPEMGGGRMAVYDTRYSAFFRKVTVDTDNSINVEPQGTTKVLDCPSLYHVLDEGYQGDYWGRLMYYGGYNLQ